MGEHPVADIFEHDRGVQQLRGARHDLGFVGFAQREVGVDFMHGAGELHGFELLGDEQLVDNLGDRHKAGATAQDNDRQAHI